ncbi:hypothetical protein EDB83DRAFT_2531847 [Lactarius deliciosus]|nr:hypothetical protein EDB83DRAFT_2531847 [Lactarius deliciosus]
MAARSSHQLPLARHIMRDHDGLWKDIRRTGPEVGPLFSAFTASRCRRVSGRYHLSVASGSLSHESRDPSSRPTSTIFSSPDTTDRHPFYAFSLRPMPRYSAFDIPRARRYAQLSLMSPPRPSLAASRLDFRALAADLFVGLATSTNRSCTRVGSISWRRACIAHRRKLLIGSLIGPSLLLRRRVVHVARCSGTLFDSEFDHGLSAQRDAGISPSISRWQTRQLTIVSPLRKCSPPSVSVRCAASPSVSEDDGERPRVYVAFCVVYDCPGIMPRISASCGSASCGTLIIWMLPLALCIRRDHNDLVGRRDGIGKWEESISLAIMATMVPGLRSGINVLFPSVRAGRTRGFSIRSKVTRDDIMGSAVGEQQERGMSISGQNVFLLVPSAQLCLRARDIIQLGRSRVYAETVDELKECFGSGVRGCFRFGKSDGDSQDVLQSQRLMTFEYGFRIEIRVLRWGLR